MYLMEMVITQFQQMMDYPTIERGGAKYGDLFHINKKFVKSRLKERAT